MYDDVIMENSESPYLQFWELPHKHGSMPKALGVYHHFTASPTSAYGIKEQGH